VSKGTLHFHPALLLADATFCIRNIRQYEQFELFRNFEIVQVSISTVSQTYDTAPTVTVTHT